MDLNRRELTDAELENVGGGTMYWDPAPGGKYTCTCSHSGLIFENISSDDMLDLMAYAADIPDTPEGEKMIIQYAKSKKIF